MIRAKERSEYFPVYYVEPFKGNEIALGFDLASDPVQREALNRARDTGEVTATARITLVQETGKQYGFLVFLPVYRQEAPRRTLEERRENLAGFVVGVFRIGDMVEKSLSYSAAKDISLRLYDESASPGERFLYSTLPPMPRDIPESRGPKGVEPTSGWRIVQTFSVADRKWLCVCEPASGFTTTRTTWYPWALLGTGLLFTSLFLAYLLITFGRTARAEQLATKLSAEIEERQKAEEAARLRARELEALFSIASLLVQPGSFEEKSTQVLQELVRVAEADRAIFRLADEEAPGMRLVAAAGEKAVVRPLQPYGEGLTGVAFAKGEVVVTNDYASHPQAVPGVVALGVRSMLALPVKAGGRSLGAIGVQSRQANHFTPERVRLLTAMAASLGMLLENARLQAEIRAELEESRRRLEAYQASVAGLALAEETDLALQHLVDTARTLVAARYGALCHWDAQGKVEKWVFSGVPPEAQAHLRALMPTRKPEGLGLIPEERQPLRLADISQHPTFQPLGSDFPPVRSFLRVPILIKGRVLGAFYLAEKEEGPEFSADDERRLSLFAALAGVLLESATLYGEVQREHRTLAAIQESMAEGLVVLDSVGRILYFNQAAAALLGLATREALGQPFEEALPLSKGGRFAESNGAKALLRFLGGSEEAPPPFEIEPLPPQRRALAVTAFPIPLAPGERLMGILLRDITQERGLEQRRNAFVSVASHELRTPMTSILGFTELLLQRDPPETIRRQWLEHIYHNSQRLTAIVDDLLNVSRIQSGKLLLTLEPLCLGEIVEELLGSLRSTTEKHDFGVELAPDLPEVMADRHKLGQVLTNLLDNAIKYSPQGGRITVSARYEPGRKRVVVGVADQGVGIGPEDKERLFTAFQRVRRPETAGVKGSGLGIYIVKSLVELMQGEVWVESELNRGSTFFFTLPTR